jgi:hypothetical protein
VMIRPDGLEVVNLESFGALNINTGRIGGADGAVRSVVRKSQRDPCSDVQCGNVALADAILFVISAPIAIMTS